jgi:hypothetical protein
MKTTHAYRLFNLRIAAGLSLAVASMTPALAADKTCDAKPVASISTLPAPGSNEAWKMAKFPWLYLPRASTAPRTTHLPEPGSAEAVTYYKTPYLHSPRTAVTRTTTHFPEQGSAEALMYYKTPYLLNRRPASDACP